MENDLPSFSVVIPSFGRRGPLIECLDALSRIDYPLERFEVIVVDDGSPEPLADVAPGFKGKIRLTMVRQQNQGPAVARNTGAAHAHGDYLAFTDSDCAPDPQWLRAIAGQIRRHPNSAVGGTVVNALTSNSYSQASQLLVSYICGYFNACSPQFFCSNNFAVPAEAFHAAGGFDTSYRRAAAEDREFCDRWLRQGRGMIASDNAVVFHAHRLTCRSFLRQHFNYGRGAFHFHRNRARQLTDRIRVEPLRFYSDLLLQPWRARSPRFATLTALLFLSQAANATGFFWEKLFGAAE